MSEPEGKSGFDWLFGRWKIENRVLDGRLRGSTTWKTFEAGYEAWPVLDGWANQDRFTAERPEGPFEGMSIRYFHADTGEWSIHWLDTRALREGRPDLVSSVRGRMHDGAGDFFGKVLFEGVEVDVRYRWRPVDRDHVTWDQAYSTDGGESWEVNWIMEFSRLADDGRASRR